MSALRTCLDIYQAVVQTFPSARTELHLEENGIVSLEIRPTEKLPSLAFSLRSAVVFEEFSHALEKLRKSIELYEANNGLSIEAINVKQLSTEIPLSEWQKFRRVTYEGMGGNCVQAIEAYLTDPADLTTLTSLGLDPEQAGGTESDYSYFREVFRNSLNMPVERRRVLLENFQERFPKIYGIFVQEGRSKEREEVAFDDDDDEGDVLRPRTVHTPPMSQTKGDAGITGSTGYLQRCWTGCKNAIHVIKNLRDSPDLKPICALVAAATNGVCVVMKCSSLVTLGCTVPTRVFSIITHRQDTGQALLQVAALVTLVGSVALDPSGSLLPFGRYAVMALDLAPGLIQAFLQIQRASIHRALTVESIIGRVPHLEDRNEALRFFGLSEQEASDPACLRERYIIPVTEFKRRLSRKKGHVSPVVRSWVTTMISYNQRAYKTLGGDPKEDDGKPYDDPD